MIGKKVSYTSGSGKVYEATVTAIPDNPGHGCTSELTVSLEFRDERGKLVRKSRVLPRHDSWTRRQTWSHEKTT